MQGFEIRQGTVYEENESGKRILLIHHNPLNLCSLLLHSEGNGKTFDVAHPERISVDEIIEIRRSGKYTEKGDLPAEDFLALLKTLLDAGSAAEEDRPFLEALRRK